MVESFEQVFEREPPAEATSTPASAGIGPLTQRAHSITGGADRCRSGVGQDGVEVWSLNASRPCRGKQGEMRRYDDPVEVRKGMVGSREAPEQFLWHGRLWKVRDVLAHWVETGPWWQSSGARAVVGDDAFAEEQPMATHDLLTEREMWRVEAGAGMTTAGVFDLSFSWSDGRWQLVGCAD